MCCRNRAPRCSTCRKRAPCHRRNCAANFPIVQPVYAQQRIYTSQPAPTRATGNDHDTPPSYDEMAWPAEKAVRYNGPKEDGSGQSNGLLGMIVRNYQSAQLDRGQGYYEGA
ncbi:hypothetical protein ABVK25_006284 [Lepraria finkii]|uniref:Uncharacterized protein n=1 Tax=Lepraria finkii TaxID=1340010 RepID=A0ABR4B601_9LECA